MSARLWHLAAKRQMALASQTVKLQAARYSAPAAWPDKLCGEIILRQNRGSVLLHYQSPHVGMSFQGPKSVGVGAEANKSGRRECVCPM